jgi:hypothetical protein
MEALNLKTIVLVVVIIVSFGSSGAFAKAQSENWPYSSSSETFPRKTPSSSNVNVGFDSDPFNRNSMNSNTFGRDADDFFKMNSNTNDDLFKRNNDEHIENFERNSRE